MPKITEILNRIWSLFRRAGIADDLTIIEDIAAILTSDLDYLDENLRPRGAPGTKGIVDYVRDLLKNALENVIYNAVRYTQKNTTVDVSLTKSLSN